MQRILQLCGLLIVLAVIGCAPPAPNVPCDRYASTSGSDSTGSGSQSAPFLTVTKLDQSLSAGQTGCLEGGLYGDYGVQHTLSSNGSAGNPIKITAAYGQTVVIRGFIVVDGAYTTLSYVNIDGSNTFYQPGNCSNLGTRSQPLQLNANGDVFEYNELEQSVAATRQSGIGIGFHSTPVGVVVRYNKIHDVGACQDFDHAIYLSHGDQTQIYGNWIWSDPYGWGIQVYPAATNSDIHSNVVWETGSGITIAGSGTSGNNVYRNVFAQATGLSCCGAYAISGSGAGASNNSFIGNDAFHDLSGIGSISGTNVSGNITDDPLFTDPANHDFTLQAGSPVASWGLWNGT